MWGHNVNQVCFAILRIDDIVKTSSFTIHWHGDERTAQELLRLIHVIVTFRVLYAMHQLPHIFRTLSRLARCVFGEEGVAYLLGVFSLEDIIGAWFTPSLSACTSCNARDKVTHTMME